MDFEIADGEVLAAAAAAFIYIAFTSQDALQPTRDKLNTNDRLQRNRNRIVIVVMTNLKSITVS